MGRKTRATSLQIGPLIVEERWGRCAITEPLSNCCIARGFPTLMQAACAAREMNDIADWFGILKTRAQGGRPNCQSELERIAEKYGGALGRGAGAGSIAACARAVAEAASTG